MSKSILNGDNFSSYLIKCSDDELFALNKELDSLINSSGYLSNVLDNLFIDMKMNLLSYAGQRYFEKNEDTDQED